MACPLNTKTPLVEVSSRLQELLYVLFPVKQNWFTPGERLAQSGLYWEQILRPHCLDLL